MWGIFITGGEDNNHRPVSSVEIFVPWTNFSCPLPNMKLRDTGHVMMEPKKLTISRESQSVLVNVDNPSGFPFFPPTLNMDHSMLTCSCRRSHHSLNQTISCGGWGDGQSKRTCEIYTPGSGWSKENYLLARPTVEHQSWGIPIRKPNFKPHPDFPGQILLLLNGNEEKLVIPKESFKKE